MEIDLLGAGGGFGKRCEYKRVTCIGALYRVENLKIAEYIDKYKFAVHGWSDQNNQNARLIRDLVDRFNRAKSQKICNHAELIKLEKPLILWIIGCENVQHYPFCPMCIEGRNKEEKMFICRHECVFQKAYRVCCIKEILITDQTFKDFEDFKNSCVGKWMDSNGWIKGYEWIKDINGDHYFYKCEIINKSIFFKITKIRDTVKHKFRIHPLQ